MVSLSSLQNGNGDDECAGTRWNGSPLGSTLRRGEQESRPLSYPLIGTAQTPPKSGESLADISRR